MLGSSLCHLASPLEMYWTYGGGQNYYRRHLGQATEAPQIWQHDAEYILTHWMPGAVLRGLRIPCIPKKGKKKILFHVLASRVLPRKSARIHYNKQDNDTHFPYPEKKETIISCLRFALPFNQDAWIPHLAAHFVWERKLLGFWAIALEFGIKTWYMA